MTPGSYCLVEFIFGLQLCTVGSLGVLVSRAGSSSTKSALSGVRNIVSSELSPVFASNGKQFVSLTALRNFDSIVVGPCLNFCSQTISTKS